MNDQSVVNGQIPQFDPAATPPPPVGGSSEDQAQAPGMVVQPTIVEPTRPGEDILTQLDQIASDPSVPNLPPPPFDQPIGGAAIQPLLPVTDEAPLAPADMNPQPVIESQDMALPTASVTASATPAFDESKFVTDPSPAVEAPTPIAEPEPVAAPQVEVETPVISEPAIDDVVQSQLESAELPVAVESSEDLPVDEPQIEVHEEAELSTAEDSDSNEHTAEVIDPAAAREHVGDLELIKHQALRELAPIANQLDQEPVERFHTLLELIQATDSHDLVQGAFESAQSIEDDKERATALLNLVNEVTYLEKLRDGHEEDDQDDGAKKSED